MIDTAIYQFEFFLEFTLVGYLSKKSVGLQTDGFLLNFKFRRNLLNFPASIIM